MSQTGEFHVDHNNENKAYDRKTTNTIIIRYRISRVQFQYTKDRHVFVIDTFIFIRPLHRNKKNQKVLNASMTVEGLFHMLELPTKSLKLFYKLRASWSVVVGL